MKKTLSFLLCIAVILPLTAYGKPSKPDKPSKNTIYSWTENGKVHYGELIPHGVTEYSTLSSRGIKIEDKRKAKPQPQNTPNKNPSKSPTSAGFNERKM